MIDSCRGRISNVSFNRHASIPWEQGSGFFPIGNLMNDVGEDWVGSITLEDEESGSFIVKKANQVS